MVRAPVVRVEDEDGRPVAHAAQASIDDGRLGWVWSGGGVPDFIIEAQGNLDSFLLTRLDLAPFGRVHRQGRLHPHLEITDARGPQLVVEADGRVLDRQHGRLGRLDLVGPGEVWVRARLPRGGSDTHRSLLLAMPICHAAHQTLPGR